MPALEKPSKLYSLANYLLGVAQVFTAAPISAVDITIFLPGLTTGSAAAQPHTADTTDMFCQVRDSRG